MKPSDDLTDLEWTILGPLLPSERGRSCRPALDNRPFVNGMLWIERTGQPWRRLPREYGKWNSVYRRFRRWSVLGIWGIFVRRLGDIRRVERSHHLRDKDEARRKVRVVDAPIEIEKRLSAARSKRPKSPRRMEPKATKDTVRPRMGRR